MNIKAGDKTTRDPATKNPDSAPKLGEGAPPVFSPAKPTKLAR